MIQARAAVPAVSKTMADANCSYKSKNRDNSAHLAGRNGALSIHGNAGLGPMRS